MARPPRRRRPAPDAPSVFGGRLADLPALFTRKGRDAGFEALVDLVLEHYEELRRDGLTPYQIIKLVLEVDRHAQFSRLSAEKARARADREAIEYYQAYLRGEVDLPARPDDATETPDAPERHPERREREDEEPTDAPHESDDHPEAS